MSFGEKKLIQTLSSKNGAKFCINNPQLLN